MRQKDKHRLPLHKIVHSTLQTVVAEFHSNLFFGNISWYLTLPTKANISVSAIYSYIPIKLLNIVYLKSAMETGQR